jgi:hypothetical protein
VANRDSSDDLAGDIGDQPRLFDERAEIVTTTLTLEQVDVVGERLAVLDEAEPEPVWRELHLGGPIDLFVCEP